MKTPERDTQSPQGLTPGRRSEVEGRSVFSQMPCAKPTRGMLGAATRVMTMVGTMAVLSLSSLTASAQKDIKTQLERVGNSHGEWNEVVGGDWREGDWFWGPHGRNMEVYSYFEAPPDNGPVEINIEFYEFDSWDHESAWLHVEDYWVHVGNFAYGEEGRRWEKPAGDKSDGAIRLYRTAESEHKKIGARQAYGDQKHEYKVIVPQDKLNGGTVSIGLKSETDSSAWDESFGFQAEVYLLDELAGGNLDSASGCLSNAFLPTDFGGTSLANLVSDQNSEMQDVANAVLCVNSNVGAKSLVQADDENLQQLKNGLINVFWDWHNKFPSYEKELWRAMNRSLGSAKGNKVMEYTGLLSSYAGLVTSADPISAVSSILGAVSATELVKSSYASGELENFQGQRLSYAEPSPFLSELVTDLVHELHFRGMWDEAWDLEISAVIGFDKLADFMANVKLAQEIYKKLEVEQGAAVRDLSDIEALGFNTDYDEEFLDWTGTRRTVYVWEGSVDPGNNVSVIEYAMHNPTNNSSVSAEDFKVHFHE